MNLWPLFECWKKLHNKRVFKIGRALHLKRSSLLQPCKSGSIIIREISACVHNRELLCKIVTFAVSRVYSLLCSHTFLVPLFVFSSIILLLLFFLLIHHSYFLESNVTVRTIQCLDFSYCQLLKYTKLNVSETGSV